MASRSAAAAATPAMIAVAPPPPPELELVWGVTVGASVGAGVGRCVGLGVGRCVGLRVGSRTDTTNLSSVGTSMKLLMIELSPSGAASAKLWIVTPSTLPVSSNFTVTKSAKVLVQTSV